MSRNYHSILNVLSPSFTNTYSLAFDGVDDYIGVNSLDTSVLPTGSFSVSVWFYATDNGFGGLFQIGDFSGNTAINVSKRANGALRFAINLSGGSVANNTVNNKYNLNEWNHAVLVFDNSITTGAVKFYINGVLDRSINESPSGQTISYPAGSELRLGQWNNTGTTDNYFFSGNIDEVSLFNTALTSEDVTTIYNSGVPNNLDDLTTPPTAWYRMGDNGSYKSPQWLIPENSNKDKVSNYSFSYDGVDDYIQLGSAVSFVGEFTLSIWVKPNGFSTSQVILGNGSSSNNWIRLSSASSITFKVGSTSLSFADVGNNLVDGVWQHLLLYRDSSNNVGIFRNGSAFSTTQSNTNTLELSTIAKRGTLEYTGSLDEIAFWQSDKSSDVTAIYNSGVPTDLSSLSPVGYWRSEQSNFTDNWLVDNSALTNYSTRSFAFDGVDDYIEVNYSTSLNITSAQTYSFWFNTTTASAMYPITYGSGSQLKYAIQLYATSNRIRLLIWDGSGVGVTIDNTEVFDDGQWHHLAFTTDALTTTDGVKIYFDGNLLTNKGTLSNNGIRSITQNLFIGKTPNSTMFRFNGNMDEISYFNSELSATDINSIYGGGTPSSISSLSPISHWRMGEDATFSTNWSLPDNGSASNTGTSANMTIADLEGNAPNYTGGGLSANMTIEDRVGDAPNSTSNALSYNMTESDRETDVPT